MVLRCSGMDEKRSQNMAMIEGFVANDDGTYTKDGIKYTFSTSETTPLEDVIMEQAAKSLANTSNEPALSYGPLRKAPTYYIGEAIGCNGKGNVKRGYFNAAGFYVVNSIAASAVRPDTQRHQNGALPGIRDKAARRMLRKAFRNAYSRTEQSVMKAHDLVNEVRGYADNSREARRNVERLDKAHTPKQLVDGRKARQGMRKARRKHKKLWGKAIARMSKAIYELGGSHV